MYIYGSRPWWAWLRQTTSGGCCLWPRRPCRGPWQCRTKLQPHTSPPLPHSLRFRSATPSPPCAARLAAARPRFIGRVMPIAGAGGLSAPPALPALAWRRLRPAGSFGWARGARPHCAVCGCVAAPCGGVAGIRAGSVVRLRCAIKSRAYARPGRRAVATLGLRRLRHCPSSSGCVRNRPLRKAL